MYAARRDASQLYSNEGGVAVCTERLENQRTAIRRLQVRDIAGQRIWNAARNLISRTKQIKQILSTLNQDNFQNSSGGKKAANDDEMGLFSQGFDGPHGVRWCRNSLVRKPQNGLWYKIKI